jgi:hypothetical protein
MQITNVRMYTGHVQCVVSLRRQIEHTDQEKLGDMGAEVAHRRKSSDTPVGIKKLKGHVARKFFCMQLAGNQRATIYVQKPEGG